MKKLALEIGEKIREYRERYNFTQEELAHQASLNAAHLGKIERGELNFTVGTLEKLLVALNVSYEEFFRFDTPAPPLSDPLAEKTKVCMKHLSLRDKHHVYDTAKLLYEKRDRQE